MEKEWRGYVLLGVIGLVALILVARGCMRGKGQSPEPGPRVVLEEEPKETLKERLAREAEERRVARREREREQIRAQEREQERLRREAQIRQQKEDAEKARAEEERRRLRAIFDGLVDDSTEGFDLIKDGLDEWGVSVELTSRDLEGMRFEGKATLRWRMPFREVSVEGRADEKGRVLIQGIDPTEAVVLDGVSAAGKVSGGSWSVESWSSGRKEKRQLRDALLSRLAEQEVEATSTVWDRRARVEKIAELDLMSPPRAQIHTDFERSRVWFDGDFNNGSDRQGSYQVSVRYPDPVTIRGVLFMCSGMAGTIRGTVMRLNGGDPIGLPSTGVRTAFLIDFGENVEVGELLLEARVGWACFNEIALLSPSS